MHTIELTDDELRLLRAALHSYLDDFGRASVGLEHELLGEDLVAREALEPVRHEVERRLEA